MDDHNIEDDSFSSEEHTSSHDGLDTSSDRNVEDNSKEVLAFHTVEDANAFYNSYGKIMGFNVRRCHKGYNKDKTIVRNVIWECSQAGFSRIPKKPLIRKPKAHTRFGCKACFRVALHDGMYTVTKFLKEHNHELLAPTSTELKSNRFISPGDEAVLTIMNDAGIRTCQILDYLKLAHEGPLNVSFKTKDVYNFLNKKRVDLVRQGDASTALLFLNGMKRKDVDFIYEHTLDENHSLSRLFWTDGFSRAQYKLFDDAPVLDSTYKTNTYGFPLVIIFGVDNNFKTCVFGGALMFNENDESYVWLFQKFIGAMGGKTPVTIMSDQDLAMHKAISSVFPLAKHRLCTWHLVRNCTNQVKKPEFSTALGLLMKKNLSTDEFDQQWQRITEAHGVATNRWVLELYDKKEQWSASHCKDHFIDMMMSTQRAESLNAHFKDRGKQGHKLTELLGHFMSDLHKLRVEACNSQYEPKLSVKRTKHGPLYKLVNHAAEVYSENIFGKVLKEIEEEQGLVVVDSRNEDHIHNYTFAKFDELDGQRWCVIIDVAKNTFQCECEMLESVGLPCRHLFSAFKHAVIMRIPSQYILNHWTKAVGQQLREHMSNLFSASDPRRQRFVQVYNEGVNLALKASQTKADTRTAVKRIR